MQGAWVSQLRKGVVELCVLAVLRPGEAYGYEILQRLGQIEGLEFSESTVYPVLSRLARAGLLSVRTAPSPRGPRRRYYALTQQGQQRLQDMTSYWHLVGRSMDRLLEPPDNGGE